MAGSNGSPWDRRLCFFLPVLIRLCLVGMRTGGFASGHPASLPYIWLQVTHDYLVLYELSPAPLNQLDGPVRHLGDP